MNIFALLLIQIATIVCIYTGARAYLYSVFVRKVQHAYFRTPLRTPYPLLPGLEDFVFSFKGISPKEWLTKSDYQNLKEWL